MKFTKKEFMGELTQLVEKALENNIEEADIIRELAAEQMHVIAVFTTNNFKQRKDHILMNYRKK